MHTQLDIINRLLESNQPVPFHVRLWNTQHIAEYLCRSVKDVSDNVVKTPGFPRPIEPVTSRGGSADTFRGRKLWKAVDVVAWAEQFHADNRVGRPRHH